MGTYQIVISKRARCDLQAIEGFYEASRPQYGRDLVKRLVVRAYSLKTFPYQGPYFQKHNDLRYLNERPYQIVYGVTITSAAKIVDIYRFWHAGQDRTRFSLREEPAVWNKTKVL